LKASHWRRVSRQLFAIRIPSTIGYAESIHAEVRAKPRWLCLRHRSARQTGREVDADIALAQRTGIKSTPTISSWPPTVRARRSRGAQPCAAALHRHRQGTRRHAAPARPRPQENPVVADLELRHAQYIAIWSLNQAIVRRWAHPRCRVSCCRSFREAQKIHAGLGQPLHGVFNRVHFPPKHCELRRTKLATGVTRSMVPCASKTSAKGASSQPGAGQHAFIKCTRHGRSVTVRTPSACKNPESNRATSCAPLRQSVILLPDASSSLRTSAGSAAVEIDLRMNRRTPVMA